MNHLRQLLFTVALVFQGFAVSANPQNAAHEPSVSGDSSSQDAYKPPPLTMESLLETDKPLNSAFMQFMTTGNREAFRKALVDQASSGHVGAQLFLAIQYIPEQCTFEPDRDAPHCGGGNQAPKVVFRSNPLDLPASYEEAAHWLELASAQGSGEASEILAQLITRMLANGHGTTYSTADSTRLHTLARSQGFDAEPIDAFCYQLERADTPGLRVTGMPKPSDFPALPGRQAPVLPEPFTASQLDELQRAGMRGVLHYEGGSGSGDSVVLMRPEGPTVHVAVVLDHMPERVMYLPIPAHHDAIYVQLGDSFRRIPEDVPLLTRSFVVTPNYAGNGQVMLGTQTMNGAVSGGACGRF